MMRLLLIFCCSLLLHVGSEAQSGEEFSGEFISWANVIKRFGAAGDGKKDDTKTLQAALDALAVQPKKTGLGPKGFTTVYLPAGTYRITKPITLKGKIGVNIIGEEPSKTTIIWDGPSDQPIFRADGSSYFRISRLTFNANNKKNITCIAIQWKTKWESETSQSFAPLNIEVSDCNFTGKPLIGIAGGTYAGGDATGANDSEVTVQRCRFNECSDVGVNITGFNALDYWIWDCSFVRCQNGIKNAHGNYHAYRCYFESSVWADFVNDNGYYTSVRYCYSVNSSYFSNDAGASCNPFKRIFQGNTIIPLSGNSIYSAHPGKPTLLDNTFYGSKDTGTYTLHYSSWCDAIYEVLSAGNKYFMADPLKMAVNRKEVFSINDRFSYKDSNKSNKDAFIKTQMPTPAYAKRKIFDVPLDASSKMIQGIINEASKMKGQKPIIHFPFGEFLLDEQLSIPAGSDIQLIGDGLIYASVLKKAANFPKDRSLLKVNGPSFITVRDMQIGDNGVALEGTLIEFSKSDQPGSSAIIDQLTSSASTSLVIDRLDYLNVQKQNSFFSSGNVVKGGRLTEQGRGTSGMYCFGGQFADLQVSGKGRFVAKDCWWEGNKRVPVNLSGSGRITLDGIMVAPVGADSGTTINVGKFNGDISIMNAYVQGAFAANPQNDNLRLLLWNVHFYHKLNPTGFLTARSTLKGAFLGLSTQNFQPGKEEIKSVPDTYTGVQRSGNFLTEMIAQDRETAPRLYSSKSTGATNIFMTRVSLGSAETGIIFSN